MIGRQHRTTIAVLLAVVVIALGVPLRGSEGQPQSATSPEVLVVRMALPSDASIRAQTVNVDVLWQIFRRWSRSSSRLGACGIHTRYQENRYELYLTVTPFNLARRADCSEEIINFFSKRPINESDFIVARSLEAEGVAARVNPGPRDRYHTNTAAERLALLSIYKEGSPLHEIYAISDTDYTKLPFDLFNQWLEDSRRDGRLTIDTVPKAPVVVDHAGRLRPSTILPPSARTPAGTFSFDGERFGVAGLILLKIPTGYRLEKFPFWKRFSCDDLDPVPGEWVGGPASIASIACIANHISDDDSWFVLIVRKNEGAEYSDFCRDVDALTHDPDLLTIIRELAHEPYVFLSPRCEDVDRSQSTVPK